MLYEATASLEKEVEEALSRRNYLGACQALAKIKGPVDAFFDKVLVMAENPKLRQNRLALLARISRTFLKVADFSKITT